jgi:hypothetical protein
VTELEALALDYRAAFLRYLPRREEAALTTAYELGRAAVESGISLLELVRIHHDIWISVLEDTPAEDVAEVASGASEFLLEVLAPYDMTQRGLLDEE